MRADAHVLAALLERVAKAGHPVGAVLAGEGALQEVGELDAGAGELAEQRAQLDDARVLMDAASEIRTVSEDGATAIGVVMFEDDVFSVPSEVVEAVSDELDQAEIDGVQVDYYSATIATAVEGLIGIGEIVGVALALLTLVIMFRALLPALLPIVSSLVGVGVGVAGSLAFSGVVDMSSATPVLGMMLGLAVGIDYALFIINRHRRQVLAGVDVHESIALANGTSGNAVVFAGSTVLVALLALNVTGIPFVGVMGTVAAGCVLVAVLLSVTLTPAMLGIIGLRIVNRRARGQIGHESHARPELKPMKTSRAFARAALAVGALLIIAGIQRGRFRTGSGGPGVVQIVEGRIAYFGPLTGGTAELGQLSRLVLDPSGKPPHWLLHQPGQLPLAIPLTAEGADALFDAFATLPGLQTERMLAEMRRDMHADHH